MYEPSKLPEFSPAVVEMERTFSPDLTGLIAWLETQDGATKYGFHTQDTCLIGHFHMAIGLKPEAFVTSLNRYGWALDGIAAQLPHTYGAALSRARAALESQP